jgi:hypothetical protein
MNNGLDCGNIRSLAINSAGTIFAGTAGCGTAVYRSTDNGGNRTLADTDQTSTDIAAIGINNDGHMFATTHSIMGQGGEMFRSTDNSDSWTEQNSGFTGFDANAVTFNLAGHVSSQPMLVVFPRPTTVLPGLTSVADSAGRKCLDGGDRGISSGGFAYAETAGDGVFRSLRATAAVGVNPRMRARPRPTPAPRP